MSVARATTIAAVRAACATVSALQTLTWAQDATAYPRSALPGWSARLTGTEDTGLGRGNSASPGWYRDVIEVRLVHPLLPGTDQLTSEATAHGHHDDIVLAVTSWPNSRAHQARHAKTHDELIGGGAYLSQTLTFNLTRYETAGAAA